MDIVYNKIKMTRILQLDYINQFEWLLYFTQYIFLQNLKSKHTLGIPFIHLVFLKDKINHPIVQQHLLELGKIILQTPPFLNPFLRQSELHCPSDAQLPSWHFISVTLYSPLDKPTTTTKN